MITPTANRFLAQRLKLKTKPGALLLTPDKPMNICLIVAACAHDEIKTGDIVATTQHGWLPFEYEDKPYIFLKEEHILAKIANTDQFEAVE